MALTFLYWAFRRLLEFLVLGFRSEEAKDIKLIVLRHNYRSSSARWTAPGYPTQIEPCSRA